MDYTFILSNMLVTVLSYTASINVLIYAEGINTVNNA